MLRLWRFRPDSSDKLNEVLNETVKALEDPDSGVHYSWQIADVGDLHVRINATTFGLSETFVKSDKTSVVADIIFADAGRLIPEKWPGAVLGNLVEERFRKLEIVDNLAPKVFVISVIRDEDTAKIEKHSDCLRMGSRVLTVLQRSRVTALMCCGLLVRPLDSSPAQTGKSATRGTGAGQPLPQSKRKKTLVDLSLNFRIKTPQPLARFVQHGMYSNWGMTRMLPYYLVIGITPTLGVKVRLVGDISTAADWAAPELEQEFADCSLVFVAAIRREPTDNLKNLPSLSARFPDKTAYCVAELKEADTAWILWRATGFSTELTNAMADHRRMLLQETALQKTISSLWLLVLFLVRKDNVGSVLELVYPSGRFSLTNLAPNNILKETDEYTEKNAAMPWLEMFCECAFKTWDVGDTLVQQTGCIYAIPGGDCIVTHNILSPTKADGLATRVNAAEWMNWNGQFKEKLNQEEIQNLDQRYHLVFDLAEGCVRRSHQLIESGLMQESDTALTVSPPEGTFWDRFSKDTRPVRRNLWSMCVVASRLRGENLASNFFQTLRTARLKDLTKLQESVRNYKFDASDEKEEVQRHRDTLFAWFATEAETPVLMRVTVLKSDETRTPDWTLPFELLDLTYSPLALQVWPLTAIVFFTLYDSVPLTLESADLVFAKKTVLPVPHIWLDNLYPGPLTTELHVQASFFLQLVADFAFCAGARLLLHDESEWRSTKPRDGKRVISDSAPLAWLRTGNLSYYTERRYVPQPQLMLPNAQKHLKTVDKDKYEIFIGYTQPERKQLQLVKGFHQSLSGKSIQKQRGRDAQLTGKYKTFWKKIKELKWNTWVKNEADYRLFRWAINGPASQFQPSDEEIDWHDHMAELSRQGAFKIDKFDPKSFSQQSEDLYRATTEPNAEHLDKLQANTDSPFQLWLSTFIIPTRDLTNYLHLPFDQLVPLERLEVLRLQAGLCAECLAPAIDEKADRMKVDIDEQERKRLDQEAIAAIEINEEEDAIEIFEEDAVVPAPAPAPAPAAPGVVIDLTQDGAMDVTFDIPPAPENEEDWDRFGEYANYVVHQKYSQYFNIKPPK